MRFIPFGGGQIGGSAYYLELDGFHFLIDAGSHPGKQQRKSDFHGLARLAGLKSATDLDAVFITHGHLDHVGGLLDLLTQAPQLPVYFHPHTGRIARALFERTPGIKDPFSRMKGYHRFLAAQESNASHDYDRPFYPAEGVRQAPVEVTFLSAGHIPGSACIRFRGAQGTVMVTGDFNDASTLFLTGTRSNPAFDEMPLDLLIAEGTYAGRWPSSGPGVVPPEALAGVVARVIDRAGLVVLPAFALGRSQEVLGLLARAIRSGELPPVPVWYDNQTSIYCEMYRKLFPDIITGGSFREGMGLDGPKLAPTETPLTGPAIIVASSGMVQPGSHAVRYVTHALRDARNAVILTGYQADGTLGAQLQEVALTGKRPDGLYSGGLFYKLRAEVFSCQLSAHADHDGLVDMVKRTRPRRLALIHRHKDDAALTRFVADVSPVPVIMPKDGEVV